MFLRVANWEEFQHYKDRNPPWIKLHRSLLTNYQFACLQDASKLHLMMIWLLASQTDNNIPADPKYLKNILNLESEPNLKELSQLGFLEGNGDASNVLAECKQLAMPEAEAEAETELELPDGSSLPKTADRPKKSAPRFKKPTAIDLHAYCTEKRLGQIGYECIPDFIDFYESKGWLVGKSPMKSWQHAFSRWVRSNEKHKRPNQSRNRTEQFFDAIQEFAASGSSPACDVDSSSFRETTSEVRPQVVEFISGRNGKGRNG